MPHSLYPPTLPGWTDSGGERWGEAFICAEDFKQGGIKSLKGIGCKTVAQPRENFREFQRGNILTKNVRK